MATFLVMFAVLSIIFGLYLYQKKQFRYWANKAVIHDEPHIIFGNLIKLLKQEQAIFQFLDELYKKYTGPVVGFYGLSKPLLMVRDLEVVKDITMTRFGDFTNHSFRPDEKIDPLGSRILFSRTDDSWRSVRTASNPAFSTSRLRGMYPRLQEVGKELLQVCTDTIARGRREINVRDIAMRYTVDVITSCAFGCRGNAISNPDTSTMYRILSKTMAFDFKQGLALNLMLFARPLYLAVGSLGLGIKVFPKFIEENVYKIVENAYEQRIREDDRKGDIFDQIVWTENPELQGLDNKAAHAFMMLIGGSETSAMTIVFALYEMSKNVHVQNQLRSEIRETMKRNDDDITTYDAIDKMEYLNQVVNETLRLWPPLPFVERISHNDYRIPGTDIVIDKETPFYIPSYSIHRDPEYFPDPDKFDPDRFANADNIPELAYIPFGAGPRFCIGKRFGLLSVKNFLVYFLNKFEVRPTTQSLRNLEWNKKSFTLYLKDGMTLAVSPVADS